MLKKTLFQHCLDHLNNNLVLYEKRKLEIIAALESESKSSAGDKHETGRAMVQLEREKLGEQIKATEKDLNILIPLENHKTSKKAGLGSLVKTNQLNYYIAISTPAVNLDNTDQYCISTQSPIGSLILGKKAGDTSSFNGKTSEITEILQTHFTEVSSLTAWGATLLLRPIQATYKIGERKERSCQRDLVVQGVNITHHNKSNVWNL